MNGFSPLADARTQPGAAKSNDHVSPFAVPLIALGVGFVAAWFTGAGMLLLTILAYGLFGAEIFLPVGRVVAFVFSALFVLVTAVGWGSWLWDRATAASAVGTKSEGRSETMTNPTNKEELVARTYQQMLADAEYEALPGTPPDGWSFIPVADVQAMGHVAISKRIRAWRTDGMTFFRVTDLTGDYARGGEAPGVWVEAWKTEPRKQVRFNPPMVLRATPESPHNPGQGDGS